MEITKIAGSRVQFEVTIPAETFKKAVDVAFEKKNKEVEIPGFRKGQAPRKVFEARFGVEVLYNDALNEAIQQTYFEAVSQNDIDICGYPDIKIDDDAKVDQEHDIKYSVTVSVNPEVELGQYTDLDIKKDKVSVTAKEVEDQINESLDRDSMLVKKEAEDAAIEKGDTAVFDFEGLKDGVAFDGGTAKDYTLEIGSGQFIPGFEDQMIGLKVGEKKALNCKFPEDYHEESLKGQDVIFNVEIKEIKVKETPELNDEWVKDQKVDGVETVDQYKAHVKEMIRSRKDNQATTKAKDALYEAVVKNAKFELPKDLIEEEAKYALENAENQAKQYGLDLQTLLMYTGGGSVEDYKKNLNDQAEKTLGLRFVLKAIAKKEAFEATAEEIEKEQEKIAEQYKVTIDQVRAQVSVDAVKEQIVNQKAYQFIEDKNPLK